MYSTILAVLPGMSPTVVLIWAKASRKVRAMFNPPVLAAEYTDRGWLMPTESFRCPWTLAAGHCEEGIVGRAVVRVD